jgi:hypothetical protein
VHRLPFGKRHFSALKTGGGFFLDIESDAHRRHVELTLLLNYSALFLGGSLKDKCTAVTRHLFDDTTIPNITL